MKINLIDLLYDVLQETVNQGLSDENIPKDMFDEKGAQEFENNYRLYGNLFGLNFISNVINKLNKLNKEESEE